MSSLWNMSPLCPPVLSLSEAVRPPFHQTPTRPRWRMGPLQWNWPQPSQRHPIVLFIMRSGKGSQFSVISLQNYSAASQKKQISPASVCWLSFSGDHLVTSPCLSLPPRVSLSLYLHLRLFGRSCRGRKFISVSCSLSAFLYFSFCLSNICYCRMKINSPWLIIYYD